MEIGPPTPSFDAGPLNLLSLLSNTLVLYYTAPYLPVSSLIALGATSKSFKDLIHHTPGVFRHLDLTQTKSAKFQLAAIDHGGEVWRNAQLDENVTEDDFYGGPLLGIFNTLRRQDLLKDVQTLVLDSLSVTAELVAEIICTDSYAVRILSIREVQNLNERKLQQALLHATRASRPPNTPKLEALYIFGPKDAVPSFRLRRRVNKYPPGIAPIDTVPSYGGVVYSRGAQIGAEWNERSGDMLADEIERNGDRWYGSGGKIISKSPSLVWGTTLQACAGLISFDATLCRGPRHSLTMDSPKVQESAPWYTSHDVYIPPRVATHALKGCAKCGSAPEGFAHFGTSPMDHFPILAPPPLHVSTVRAAKTPSASEDPTRSKLLVRCAECLRSRFCERCNKWWCENCFELPGTAPPLKLWESSGGRKSEQVEENLKVHMGLCVEHCLVEEMMSGAGSNGMWG